MPVISPRRTSSTSSGSLYIPPSTATTSSNLSSSLGKSSSPSTNATSSGYSSTYRSNSLSKPASSNYSSSFGYSGSYSTSSYLPRTSAYRSGGGGTSSYGSSALTGGSSYLSSYRPSSYLSSGNNDTAASSRFGVSRNSSCRHSRSYSDRDLPPQHSSPRRRSSFSKTLTSISNKNNNNNSSTDYYDTLTRKYSTTHTTATTRPSSPSKISANESASSDLKPPIYGGRSRSSSLRYVTNLLPNNSGTKQQLRDEHNGDDNVDYNCNYNSLKSSSSSLSFFSATKSDSNATSCNNHKINNNNCCNCLDSVNNLNDINDDNSFQSKPTITTTTTTNVSSTSGSNINSTITNAITTTDTIATATATNHSPNPHHHHHHQLQKKLEYSKDDHDGTKMSTNKSNSNSNSTFSRLSGSYSSSSLARLVATSGLDLYEKYSPAHYIPKCELSRSRSVSEATTSVSKNAVHTAANGSSSGSNENYSQAGRHSQNGLRDNNNHDDSEPHLNNISNITSRRNGLSHHTRSVADNADDDDDDVVNGSGGGRNDITTRNHLRDLKISSYSTIDNDTATASEQDAAATTTSSSKLETQFANNKVRNASIRSALPPPSPTPSRYWDRDSGSSRSLLLSSSRNLSSDGKSSSSALSNSSLDEKPQTEGLCGLRNIGNTCFMNSIIQCLSHTSELTKFLKTQTGIRSASSKDQQILYEFAKLIREMWTSNVHSVTPMELKRAFSSKHRMYSDYNQQDAQEFLRFFLDSLHSALNSGVKGEHLKLDDSMSDNKKADLTWDWYTKHENSLIRDLFVGQLKSTLRCTTCGNTSVTFDPFWDLSVPLPSSTRCKLDACLDFFIREEILDGDEMPTCSKCQTRRKCTKSFRIQRFPKYLAIHLKRFSETRWSKMSNIVEFPTGERELNMGPYGSNSSTNAYYSLYAISNHMGSTAGGHYVALCKHPVARKWHEFNDNIVSDDLSESHLVSSSAYILFYERA